MTLKIKKTDVWVAEIDDRPGGLARTMRVLADTGANLEGVLARRESGTPGKGVVFVTPLEGREQLDHAKEAGFHPAQRVPTLKIEGIDRPGLGAELTKTVGGAGISMHGLTASIIGRKFVCYIGFDSVEDMEKAEKALAPMTKWHWPTWPGSGKKPKAAEKKAA
jgi:hypothetical protein